LEGKAQTFVNPSVGGAVFLMEKDPAADATYAPQHPYDEDEDDDYFLSFRSNGTPVE
jgi:hypothetical protein